MMEVCPSFLPSFLPFIYLFLERGRERNINVWLPLEHPLLGVLAHNLGKHLRLGLELVTLWFAG